MSKSEAEARYIEQTEHTFSLTQTNDTALYLFVKRVMDLFGAVMALILTSPLFLIISLMYLHGKQKGPVFFRQIRIGQNGNKFYIYKFRSMIVDAEKKLKLNPELYNKYLKNNYKLEPDEDPRITKIGRFLRKTSLDELPQLINVLKGEMSLVGPRPVVKEELEEYKENVNLFLSARPGVTGYWQATGRSEIEYPERCNVELYYINHKSILFDLQIIFKTIVSVVSKKGAY